MRFHEFLLTGLLLLRPALAQDDEDPPPDADPTEDPEPPAPTPTGIDSFANVTVYQPDDYSTPVTFPRTENLPNNTVLAVWNQPAAANGALQVYRSSNSGFSWYSQGTVATKTRGRVLQQPHIAYVPGTGQTDDDGNVDSGVVLAAVNAVDSKSTNIEVYASWDLGKSWEFASQVVSGGPLVATGGTAVMNPYIVLNGKRTTVFYSVQRGQSGAKLAQKSTNDYYDTWGAATDVEVSSTTTDNLGFPAVAKLPNNQYILTYTRSVLDSATKTYTSNPVYYKLASSPEKFGAATARSITADTGRVPEGASTVTWSALGDPKNGTIVMSDSTTSYIFVNEGLGDGIWADYPSTAGWAEGREVKAPNNDNKKLRITGGANNPTQILLTVMDLAKALGW